MRVVIQRVKHASVHVDGKEISKINKGLMILLGIEDADTREDVDWLCGKVSRLRVFPDENDVMNKSVLEADGELMVVSQFTLHASTKKGNRPSYTKAARPDFSIPMYEKFVDCLQATSGKPVACGEFGADMDIELCNWGPVTIIIDSKIRE